MQVMPKGYVGLAGVVVMWFIDNGQRYVLMVRQEKQAGNQARFLSCLGLSGASDMGSALRTIARLQLGEVFANTVLKPKVLGMDRVASAPLLKYTDDNLGVPTPVQGLVWLVQISPHMLDVIITPHGVQAVRVPTAALDSERVSPTHAALFKAVAQQLPVFKPNHLGNAQRIEETILELTADTGRIVH